MAVMSYPKMQHLTNFYHAASGGVSEFYRALFQHANECGREIRLVVPREQGGPEQRRGPCGRIYCIMAPRARCRIAVTA
jgi:hypothetical protein